MVYTIKFKNILPNNSTIDILATPLHNYTYISSSNGYIYFNYADADDGSLINYTSIYDPGTNKIITGYGLFVMPAVSVNILVTNIPLSDTLILSINDSSILCGSCDHCFPCEVTTTIVSDPQSVFLSANPNVQIAALIFNGGISPGTNYTGTFVLYAA